MLDDLFQTVCGTGLDEFFTDVICNIYFEHIRYCYVEEEFGQDSDLIYSTSPLDGVWLYESELCTPKYKLAHQHQITDNR